MENNPIQSIVFGGGCFWCTEAVFQSLRGVLAVRPGYAGGSTDNPTYEAVGSGTTGHAEVVQIEFDPAQISLNDLLSVFFAVHDPTTPNRQGADVGTQYRSMILYSTGEQKAEAMQFIRTLEQEQIFSNPIVTEVQQLQAFYPAEQDHIDYYANNPNRPYCQVVINPKLENLKLKFAQLLKPPSDR